MNQTERAFFELIKAGLWERSITLKEFGDIDYASIYKLAEAQSALGLVTAGLEHVIDIKIPQTVVLEFIGGTLQIEQRNKAMNVFISKLIDDLRKQGVYTLLVKGQGVAQCYERPLWRSSGDIDLFLSNDNYEKAKKVLMKMATSAEKESVTSKHLALEIDNCLVEIHGMLYSSLSHKILLGLNKITQDTFYGGNVRSWMDGNVQVFLLGAQNDAIYTFTHFLGHFYKGGIGIRQICDWSRLLWTYKDKINPVLLEKKIRSMGLLSEWMAFGAFAVDYLGMPKEAMPLYSSEKKWKRKASRISSFILKVGNFGHNRDNSYYGKPYIERKVISLSVRMGDLARHASIFPIDSLRFLPRIIFCGIRSVVKGE